MPPPTISHPATTKSPPSHLLHSTVANNNCLHTFGNLQADRTRECRHSRQTLAKPSYNQTQCNSAATETCQRPSRRRYSSIYAVGAVLQHIKIQAKQHNTTSTFAQSLNRSIVRRLRIIRLVRGTNNVHKVPQTSGIARGSCPLFTAPPPAHSSNQQPKSTSQAHKSINNSSFLLHLTTHVNESST